MPSSATLSTGPGPYAVASAPSSGSDFACVSRSVGQLVGCDVGTSACVG